MNGRRRNRVGLVVVSLVVLVAVAALAAGCGSAKKRASTAPYNNTGRHSTAIAYVKVLPGKLTLLRGATSTVRLNTAKRAFAVVVRNDGDHVEQNVKVTLTIGQKPPSASITRTMSIAEILSGRSKQVVFRGPFPITTLISVVPVRVFVHPVPGEASTANNAATYDVRFSY